MATVGVVLFRNSAQETKPILQESMKNSININNNSAGPKIEKREIIIVRKKQKIVPSEVKRPSKTSEPRGAAPQAVARRNARERNRVRQVNNGFAALRRHIPDDVAEAFENANSNRGPNKKLSKVETLRMAVEYIRSLEKLLDIGDGKENSLSPSMVSFPSPASSSPRDRSNYDRSYFSLDSPLMDDDDEDSNPPTPLPSANRHQYARIPGTNNFQLVAAPLMYEDEDNNQPLTPSSDLIMQDDLLVNTQLLDASYQFMHAAEQEFTIIEPGNIPSGPDSNITIHEPSVLSGMDQKYVTIPLSELQGHLMNEEAVILGHINTVDPRLVLPDDKIDCLPNHHGGVMVENSVIMHANDYYIQDSILKAEIPDIDDDEEGEDCENTQNLQEVMDWWKQKGGQS